MTGYPPETGEETLDRLGQGKAAFFQSKKGYRFSLDAILLARFAKIGLRDRIADLGTGNGVIPILLSILNPSARITGLEIQPQMVRRACRNVRLNGLQDRIEIVPGDVRSIEGALPSGAFDGALSNPPFRVLKSGRINPDPERRIARHEVHGCIEDFLRAGRHLLRAGGKMALVYPAARTADMIHAMRQQAVEPKRVRFVHSFQGAPATLILAEGVKGAGSELEILPPLTIYTREKTYTEEVRAMLEL